MKLELTDEDAMNLIKILKLLLKKYDVTIGQGIKMDIELESIEKDSFILSYFTSRSGKIKFLSIFVKNIRI